MSGFQLQRLGQIMEPEPGNPLESEGVLNPAAVRGPDGKLFTSFHGSSRGATIRVSVLPVHNSTMLVTRSASRLGIALESEADYERRADGGGGEDPRITFVQPLRHYVMTYPALARASARCPLSFGQASVDSNATARASRDCRQRNVSNWH
jgi:hypothetical protein